MDASNNQKLYEKLFAAEGGQSPTEVDANIQEAWKEVWCVKIPSKLHVYNVPHLPVDYFAEMEPEEFGDLQDRHSKAQLRIRDWLQTGKSQNACIVLNEVHFTYAECNVEYSPVRSSGPPHQRVFTQKCVLTMGERFSVGRFGTASSKKDANAQAASKVLLALLSSKFESM